MRAWRQARTGRGEEGFSIVEMTVSLALLAVVAAFFAAQVATSYRVYGEAKDRTLAEQIATEVIEQGRSIPYDDLAATTGGVLPKTKTVTREGVGFTVRTSVKLIADPIPGGFNTGADLKEMRVTVTRRNSTKTIVDLVTRIQPNVKPSIARGTIEVRVVDYAINTPIQGATVSVSAGPSPETSDDTDAAGNVRFTGLLKTNAAAPGNWYEVRAESAGYTTFPEDVPPYPAAVTQMVPSQVFSTVIRMFKTVSITPRIVFADGTPYPYPASVTISSPRGSQTFPVTGTATISTVGTWPVMPSEQYTVTATATVFGQTVTAPAVTAQVPANYPVTLDREFLMVMPDLPKQDVTIRTLDSLGLAVPNVALTVTEGDTAVNVTATSDASGTAVIRLPRSTAPYTITAPAGGPVPAVVTTSVTVGSSPVTASLTVLTAATIRVYVSDATGAPAPGLEVRIRGGDRSLNLSGTVDASGVATIAVPPSATPYEIDVPNSPAGPGSLQRFTVNGDATYDVYLGDSFRVTVFSPAGEKVADVRVEVSGGDLGISVWAMTDGNGRADIPLPPSVTPYAVTVPPIPGTRAYATTVLNDPPRKLDVTLVAA